MKLDDRPARTDLTDRECAKLIGGLVGNLLQMSDQQSVRRALQWWVDLPGKHWDDFSAQLLRMIKKKTSIRTSTLFAWGLKRNA